LVSPGRGYKEQGERIVISMVSFICATFRRRARDGGGGGGNLGLCAMRGRYKSPDVTQARHIFVDDSVGRLTGDRALFRFSPQGERGVRSDSPMALIAELISPQAMLAPSSVVALRRPGVALRP